MHEEDMRPLFRAWAVILAIGFLITLVLFDFLFAILVLVISVLAILLCVLGGAALVFLDYERNRKAK